MSLPRYPEYKDSGISWVGECPSHWGSLRTKTLFELMKRHPREEDGVVTAFRDGEVTLRSNRRTDGFTNSLQEIGYQGIRRGDLVIHAMDAFAGAIGVSDSDGKSTPVYSVCKPRQGLSDSRYYGRLLRHMAMSGFIESLAKGIRERSTEFRWAEAGNVYLPVPPVEEQTAIAAFLDRETAKIDGLIAEQEKLIALLAEKRQATISHAVTRGLNPDATMKDSGVAWLGEVPEHWDIQSFRRQILRLEQGWSPNAAAEPCAAGAWGVLKVSAVKAGRFAEQENKALLEETVPDASIAVSPGDLLITRANTPYLVGDCCVVPLHVNQKLMLSDLIYRLRLHPGCNPQFFCYLLRSDFGRSQIKSDARGSSMTMAKISQGHILAWTVVFPPLDEQLKIVERLSAEEERFDSLDECARRAISLLGERRSALIAAAVTGQIDVRNVATT